MAARSLRLSVFLFAVATGVFGQVGNGTITGTVSDPAGAVLPGAKVEAKNAETGVVYNGQSTNAGVYTISDLPVGTYTVSAAVTGFKTYSHSNLVMPAAGTLRENIALQVGTSSESITVTAEASLLKTESAEMAHNVTLDSLDALPLIGIGTTNAGTSGYRNPYNSLLTLPGVSGYNASGTFEINGLGQAFVTTETMRVEGQDSTSRLFGAYDYTQMAQPSVDSVQEIAYQTSNYAPEYGQAGSVVINMTMKSGTNQYHGTGYDYFVNEALDAGDPFTRSGGCNVGPTGQACSTVGGSGGKYDPRQRRNDFGGTLGGPIYIPKIYNGHNKSFFFFNYEEYLETNQYGFTDTVPTAAYLKGDFSAISPNGNCSACTQLGISPTALGTPKVQLDPNGQMVFANEIFNPMSRAVATSGVLAGQGYATPFVNNMIPMTMFDPIAMKILSFVPAANNGNANQFVGNYSTTRLGNRYSAIPSFKIDHNLGAKDKLSFYYSENTTSNQYNPTLGGDDGLPVTITAARGSFITNYQERLNYDRTLTPTLLLHLGAGAYHQSFIDNSPEITFNTQQTLGLAGSLVNRNFPLVQGNCTIVTGIACTNATGGMLNLGPTAGQGPSYEMRPTGTASITWVHGAHTFKLGGEMDYEQAYSKPHPLVTLYSGTAATSDPFVNTNSYGSFSPGFGFASFLLGDMGYNSTLTVPGTSQSVPIDTRIASIDWAMYIQDSWKVTRKLTLDYGLRWDYDTAAHEQYNRWAQINPTLANTNAGGHPGALQFANNCNCAFYKPTYPYAVGPRIGLAYQIDSKTVLRAGWGVNYQFVSANAGATVSSPGTYNLQANNPAYVPSGSQFVNLETPGAVQSPVWPVTNPYQYPNLGATSPAPSVPDGNENRPPRISQWSIGLQREVSRNFVVEAAYVGNIGVWEQPFGGSLSQLSRLSPQYLATLGLYPVPGTGPAGYNNLLDRNLLNDPISSIAVQQWATSQGRTTVLPYTGFPTNATLQSALYPFPQFGGINPSNAPTEKSKYDSLQIKVTKRLSHGIQASGSYTWAKGFYSIQSRQDFFNPGSGQWVLQNIPPQTLSFNITYTVPKATFLPRFANLITKDWQLGWFSDYQSGVFLTPPNSTTTNYLPSEEVRVPGQSLYASGVNINDLSTYNPYYTQVLNPAAWQQCGSNAACTSQGTLYTDFRAPRTPSENANVARNFRIKERMNLQVRAEFVNIFNRTIMPAPSSTALPQTLPSKNGLGIYTSGFGIINAYAAPNATAAAAPFLTGRQGTLIFRFSF